MTDKAHAAFVSINFETGEVLTEQYKEEDGYENPMVSAENCKRSVEGDFPDHEHFVVGNKRAGELRGKWFMKQLGLGDVPKSKG